MISTRQHFWSLMRERNERLADGKVEERPSGPPRTVQPGRLSGHRLDRRPDESAAESRGDDSVSEEDDIGGHHRHGRRQQHRDRATVDTDIREMLAGDTLSMSVLPANGILVFVMLDQGKSFYRAPLPVPARFGGTLLVPGSVCVFRRTTAVGVRRLRGGQWLQYVKHVVPDPIWQGIGLKRLQWAQLRLDQIAYHMDYCAQTLGGDRRVLMWD